MRRIQLQLLPQKQYFLNLPSLVWEKLKDFLLTDETLRELKTKLKDREKELGTLQDLVSFYREKEQANLFTPEDNLPSSPLFLDAKTDVLDNIFTRP